MNANVRLEDWSAEKMQDPELRAAYEALEPAYPISGELWVQDV
ncbi:MAG: hypothetical protein NT169_04085 [Chloroflexi bacterium]|nr:hypothetical protein [Chloroflexota bacterium]